LYTLFNTETKKTLIHPQVGLWTAPTLKEAEEMLAACHEYVKAIGHSELVPALVVRFVENVEEA
jgi:hypothetical protein